VSTSFVQFAQSLPIVKSPTNVYSLLELVSDLIDHAKCNMASNAVVIPVFQTFVLLLEVDSLRQLPTEVEGMKRRVLLRDVSVD